MEIHAIVTEHWTQLRQMTYDLLAVLEANALGLKLNFERSQSIGYQFEVPPLTVPPRMRG